jgi:hypothetical protein
MDKPQTQYIEIPIDGGLDTRTAPERVSLTRSLQHEDGSFREPGAVNRRLAYVGLQSLSIVGEATATRDAGMRALLSDGEALLGIGADDSAAYSYLDGELRWVLSDRTAGFPLTRRYDIAAASDADYLALARVNGWLVVVLQQKSLAPATAWLIEESTLQVRAILETDVTSTVPGESAVAGAKLAAIDPVYVVGLWVDGTTLKASRLDTSIPHASWSTAVDLATGLTSPCFAVWARPGASSAYVAACDTNGVFVFELEVVGGVPTAGTPLDLTGTANAVGGLAMAGDVAGDHDLLLVGFVDDSGGVHSAVVDASTLTEVAAPQVIDGSITSVHAITALTYEVGGTPYGTISYAAPVASDGAEALTLHQRINMSTGAAAATHEDKGVYPWATPFRARGMDVHALARSQDLESTLYLFAQQEWNGLSAAAGGKSGPVARMLPYTAERLSSSTAQHRVIAIVRGDNADRWYVVAFEPAVVDVSGQGFIALFVIDMDPPRQSVFERWLMVAGAQPRYWERDLLGGKGAAVARGFSAFVPLHSPVVEQLVASAGAGSLTSSETYFYRFTVEYETADGRRAQSQPSAPREVTLGGGDNTVTITLAGTLWQGPPGVEATYARIVVWRTEGNATDEIYYRAGHTTSYQQTTFIDTLGDDDLTEREILYTVSGELANVPPPPCLALFAWQGRIVALSSEHHELWISKSVIPGSVPGWNEAIVIETGVRAGRPVYATALGQQIVVFWSDAIGVVYGTPPSDTGAGGTFDKPTIVYSGVGLAEVASLVETPAGLFFRSRRGIYLLDRGLGLAFVGAEVSGLVQHPTWSDDNAIVGAHYVSDRDEVRFVFQGAQILVYHLLEQKWHRHLLSEAPEEQGA